MSLGNPLLFNTTRIKFPFGVLMGQKRKQGYLEHWKSFHKMKDSLSRSAFWKMLVSMNLAGLDGAIAPVAARNQAFYPFAFRVGYKDAKSYWLDSGSFRHIRFISVPFLQLTAEDDFLVYSHSKNKLGFSVPNPNVMVVDTRCGGHLGWQESPPESRSSFGVSSWADTAAADFFDAILQVNSEQKRTSVTETSKKPNEASGSLDIDFDFETMKATSLSESQNLRSRL